MPTSQVELKVAHLFKAIIEGEKQLEVYRQVLVEQPEFDPYLTFNFLDKASNGYLSPISIAEFLKEHSIEVLDTDLVKIFTAESSKSDPRLNFHDFLKVILPRASPSLRQLSLINSTAKTPKKKDATISYEIKWALARVIDKQVNFLKKIDSCRDVVAKFGDFTIPHVFKAIDVDDNDTIDIDSIYIFLKKNRVFVSENDVMILLRSIDFAEDGKLSFEEFIQIVQPNSTHLQRPTKTTTTSRSRSPTKSKSKSKSKSPAPSKASKTKSKSPNHTMLAPPQRKNSAVSYKEKMNMSMTGPRHSSSDRRSRANSTVNYGTLRTWKDKSFNEYSTIINVPNTMNTSMGSIGNNTNTRKSSAKKAAASPMRTRSTATSELKNLQDRIYGRNSRVQNKPEKIETAQSFLTEENNMNKEEERELASVLREQITLDREIEVMKHELSLQPDFNVADIFRLFDVESRGLINKYQLLDGFDLFHVNANKKELYLLMKRFDRDRDGLLRYADFYDLLTPRQEDKNSSYLAQKKLPRVLSMKTTFLLRKMLQTTLSNESCSECLRQRLHARPGFSAYKAFKVLDRNMNGYITIEDFRELLENYGLYASQKELAGLMGRFDKNHDDRVSYNDFVEEIRPRGVEKQRK